MERTPISRHTTRHASLDEHHEHDRYPHEARPRRRSHSRAHRHNLPEGASSFHTRVREGLLTPPSSRSTHAKGRSSEFYRSPSHSTHTSGHSSSHRSNSGSHLSISHTSSPHRSPSASANHSPRERRRGDGLLTPPPSSVSHSTHTSISHDSHAGGQSSPHRSPRSPHHNDHGRVTILLPPRTPSRERAPNVLRKRNRSYRNLSGREQASTSPPQSHRRWHSHTAHGHPEQAHPHPVEGIHYAAPHYQTYDPNDSGAAWPVPAIPQIQHVEVGLERRNASRRRRRRESRERSDAVEDHERHATRKHSNSSSPPAYEEPHHGRRHSSRRKSDRSPSDVPSYLMHAREQIHRQALENIKEMAQPAGFFEKQELKTRFYNEHYVHLSQLLCSNMEAWLRFRVQELFRLFYHSIAHCAHSDLARKSCRAPLEDRSWTEFETSHPASFCKRFLFGRRVRKDYAALKKDLLDALGSLTPEPKLVFDCLVRGPISMKRCYCTLTKHEQSLEASSPTESKSCPRCHQPYLPPASLVDLFYQLHAPGFASTDGRLFDARKHFARTSARFARLFAGVQSKRHGWKGEGKGEGWWEDRTGRFVQGLMNFVEASRYWSTGENTSRGVNTYTRLYREMSSESEATLKMGEAAKGQWVRPLDGRHYDLGSSR